MRLYINLFTIGILLLLGIILILCYTSILLFKNDKKILSALSAVTVIALVLLFFLYSLPNCNKMLEENIKHKSGVISGEVLNKVVEDKDFDIYRLEVKDYITGNIEKFSVYSGDVTLVKTTSEQYIKTIDKDKYEIGYRVNTPETINGKVIGEVEIVSNNYKLVVEDYVTKETKTVTISKEDVSFVKTSEEPYLHKLAAGLYEIGVN